MYLVKLHFKLSTKWRGIEIWPCVASLKLWTFPQAGCRWYTGAAPLFTSIECESKTGYIQMHFTFLLTTSLKIHAPNSVSAVLCFISINSCLDEASNLVFILQSLINSCFHNAELSKLGSRCLSQELIEKQTKTYTIIIIIICSDRNLSAELCYCHHLTVLWKYKLWQIFVNNCTSEQKEILSDALWVSGPLLVMRLI